MTHRHDNTILAQFVERQPGIVGAMLQRGRRRAADVSQQMSRRGAMAASAELVNSAAARLIELAYERDEVGSATWIRQLASSCLAFPYRGQVDCTCAMGCAELRPIAWPSTFAGYMRRPRLHLCSRSTRPAENGPSTSSIILPLAQRLRTGASAN